MIQSRKGTLTAGSAITNFDVNEIDLSMSDEEVFQAALRNAAQAKATSPKTVAACMHHMQADGSVQRNDEGLVRVKGEGWIIEYKTEEFIAKFNKLRDSKDWVAFAALTQFDTVTEFNKTGGKKP